jgi:hypothetical protein
MNGDDRRCETSLRRFDPDVLAARALAWAPGPGPALTTDRAGYLMTRSVAREEWPNTFVSSQVVRTLAARPTQGGRSGQRPEHPANSIGWMNVIARRLRTAKPNRSVPTIQSASKSLRGEFRVGLLGVKEGFYSAVGAGLFAALIGLLVYAQEISAKFLPAISGFLALSDRVISVFVGLVRPSSH